MKYCIIKTTCKNRQEAEFLAKLLLNKKLVACAQISKIESFYNWENKIQNDEEFELSLKTKAQNYEEIEALIIKNHSYEIPQILLIPIDGGLTTYLDWIKKNTN